MSTNRAICYVEELPPGAVSRTEYFVLLRIADNWRERFKAAVMPMAHLSDDVRMSERGLRYVIKRLEAAGILKHKPGWAQAIVVNSSSQLWREKRE